MIDTGQAKSTEFNKRNRNEPRMNSIMVTPEKRNEENEVDPREKPAIMLNGVEYIKRIRNYKEDEKRKKEQKATVKEILENDADKEDDTVGRDLNLCGECGEYGHYAEECNEESYTKGSWSTMKANYRIGLF